MKITYDSNNSGGRWWLTDDNWKALEMAGWTVIWGDWYFCNARFRMSHDKPPKNHVPCEGQCEGHQQFQSPDEMTNADRWLGSLAREAYKHFLKPEDALREFELLTGQNVMDEGCNCCGAPHCFQWEDETGKRHYVSGEKCATVLFPGAPTTLREALERKG